MRRFLIATASMVALSFVAWMLAVLVTGSLLPQAFRINLPYFRSENYGHTFTRLSEADTIGEVDIVVLGSSHAYRGFDPRIFRAHGLSMFNLGSSAQTPIESEYLLKTYLSVLKPSVVVVEVDPSNLGSDGVEAAVDIIPKAELSLDLLIMTLRVNKIKAYNVLCFRLWDEWLFKSQRAKTKERLVTNVDTYVSGGYVQKKAEVFNPAEQAQSERDIAVNSRQVQSLRAIVELCRAAGNKVVFVQAPITKHRLASFRSLDRFDVLFGSLEPSAYLNYNLISPLSDTVHFYDGHHLNQMGVEIFNKSVVQLLEAELPK